jgi:hypothetical protein
MLEQQKSASPDTAEQSETNTDSAYDIDQLVASAMIELLEIREAVLTELAPETSRAIH